MYDNFWPDGWVEHDIKLGLLIRRVFPADLNSDASNLAMAISLRLGRLFRWGMHLEARKTPQTAEQTGAEALDELISLLQQLDELHPPDRSVDTYRDLVYRAVATGYPQTRELKELLLSIKERPRELLTQKATQDQIYAIKESYQNLWLSLAAKPMPSGCFG